LRLSEKDLRFANSVSEVEATGDLPGSSAEWRGGSTATLTYAAPGHSPESRIKSKQAPAANAQRRRRGSA
jgi:hypothetical protein